MSKALELVYSLKDSYSGAFVLFWVLILISCVCLWVIETQNAHRSFKLERALFWIFGSAMLAFSAFRPIGIARDDMPYLEIYNTVCPALICGQWVQGARDWGWYSLVGLLKSFVPEPSVMLWIGTGALLLKLATIYSLVRRPLFVLLLYVGLFYEVQDLTAWRVSLAIAFFMLAIWLVARLRNYWAGWALITCGLFHKQAFVAPLILLGCVIKRSRWLLVTLSVTPILLMLLGIYPEVQQVLLSMGSDGQRLVLSGGLDVYLTAKNAVNNEWWRKAPVVVYPQILLVLWLLLRERLSNGWLESLMTGCLVMGCLFLWGFASMIDAQVRFFEFFMAPTVFLVGMRRLNTIEFTGLVTVSGTFVLKYNVFHHLLV